MSVLCSPPSDLCGMCCFLFGSVLPVDVCGAVVPVLVSNGFMVSIFESCLHVKNGSDSDITL